MHVNTTQTPLLTLNTKIMNKVVVCIHQEILSGFFLRSWLGIMLGKFYDFGKIITVVFSGLGTFVEESGQERYWAHIVYKWGPSITPLESYYMVYSNKKFHV